MDELSNGPQLNNNYSTGWSMTKKVKQCVQVPCCQVSCPQLDAISIEWSARTSTFTLEGKDWATEEPKGTDNLALWKFATVRVKKETSSYEWGILVQANTHTEHQVFLNALYWSNKVKEAVLHYE